MTSSEFGTTSTSGDHPLSGGYPAGGYVPPADDIYRAPTVDDDPSTADVAKGQASAVAGGAADAASHVAGVAKEQAGQVTAEATRQVKHLVGQAQSELSSQASSQQERAASGLRSVGEQLSAMANGSGGPGVAADLAKQAADKVHEVAGWLENKEPADLLADVRAYARRRPGMFLAIALGAGVVAGRLVRGATTNPDQVGQGNDNRQLSGGQHSGYPSQTAGYPSQAGGYPSQGTGYLTSPPPLTAGAGYDAPAKDWTGAPVGGLGDAR